MPPAARRPAARSSLLATLVVTLLKLVWTAIVVSLPLLGVWLGSSLAAYGNGPLWATIVAGLLAFPILPLAWDGYSSLRRRKRGAKERILTFWDRITLRTLAINLVFLGALLGLNPEVAFTALSTRGDWFLEHARGPWVPKVRAQVFLVADRLEWLYDATHENPFEDDSKDRPPKARPTPTEVPVPQPSTGSPPPPIPSSTTVPPPPPIPPGEQPPPPPPAPGGGEVVAKRWPFEGALHPLVAAVPAEVESSYEEVARWIAAREPDAALRVKALHDYVADRVAYDAESYYSGNYPPMDPKIVFDRRAGVCAGYAKLFEAMGRAAGETVHYVTGNSRDRGGDVSGQGHAWNAVLVDGAYHLVDVTWDSGYLEDKHFVKRYSSDYFLTPPEIFGNNHLPAEEQWQVRERPISRGDFMRQPNLRPRFFAKGLRLIDPTRSQITVADDVRLVLENPRGQSILASYEEKGSDKRERCRVTPGPKSEVLCDLKREGTFHVVLFANDTPEGSHPFVGQIEVNRGR